MRLTPQTRQTVFKSFVLAMAFWAYLHLFSAIGYAIKYRSWNQLNPYKLIKFDGILGSLGQKRWAALLGWGFFLVSVTLAYKLIRRFKL